VVASALLVIKAMTGYITSTVVEWLRTTPNTRVNAKFVINSKFFANWVLTPKFGVKSTYLFVNSRSSE